MKDLNLRLFPRTGANGVFHVGDTEEDTNINLKDYTIFVYKHEQNSEHLRIVFRKKEKKNENR